MFVNTDHTYFVGAFLTTWVAVELSIPAGTSTCKWHINHDQTLGEVEQHFWDSRHHCQTLEQHFWDSWQKAQTLEQHFWDS